MQELLKESRQASIHDILNDGQEDQMLITGYKRSIFRTSLCYVAFTGTLGMLRLVMHWHSHWLLLATHTKCSLDLAEKVLIQELFQEKHSVYYVKDVISLNQKSMNELTASSRVRDQNSQKLRTKLNDYEINKFSHYINKGKPFQISIHYKNGIFEHMASIRFFCCKKLRYIWNKECKKFYQLKGLDVNVPSSGLHQIRGLSGHEQYIRRLVYGSNEIIIPIKEIFTLLFLEILNPFYVFQLFSVCLWFSYNYFYYAIVIMMMSAFGITMSIVQTRKNQKSLSSTVEKKDIVNVIRDNYESETIDKKFIVPGDLLEIPSTGCLMTCDAVLISGNCIIDESMLTGESVPVTKTPLPYMSDESYDTREHARHTLFCGTKVIQTRYIGNEKVLVKVINTGNTTAKGGLIRSILYPPPVDYKFEQDSYKFIMLLGVIATVGFFYTIFTKVTRGISAAKIAIESLDLITIAVPPALPAAMTVGRIYAQRRLKSKNIFCISPRAINVSGSIDCVCFDKTGTLTEAGLDMWGVVPKNVTNQFQIPLLQIKRLPFKDNLLCGMLTCHSITLIKGEMRGDPLDLKMFESTGWILEEANVHDTTKYDLLFPTIVKPPKIKVGVKNVNLPKGEGETNDVYDIGIVREFSFTSNLQRMSVITRKLSDDHFNVYCKGSPEMIYTLCEPSTIPHDFHSKLEYYTQQGYRIISVAYKSLDRKVNYSKVQRITREKIESDLIFLGFVVLENRLKNDTVEVIKHLTSANIRTIMVTGDNLLTAVSVAKDCGMISSEHNLIMVNVKTCDNNPDKFELLYNITGQIGLEVLSNSNDFGTSNYKRINVNNSMSSFGTIGASTQSTQISRETSFDDIEKGVITDSGKNCRSYRFAMTGKTWAVIKEYFPDYVSTFITRGIVFARMSPDQKQQLIMELQHIDYYVAMCGDGANDCGALRAAHTGISLSEAESSVASPFTSKSATIACVPNIIKEGRAALVTSFGIFKYMAAYSLVQFTSVLILYSIDSNLTDFEFLYIDLFLISIFAFFFGRTASYNGQLVIQAPSNSLISMSPLVSLVLHFVVALAFQIGVWFSVQSQPWFIPFNFTDSSHSNDLGCHQNYTIFIMSCFQYIILAIIFSKGAPYRDTIVSNHGLLFSIILNISFTMYVTLYPSTFIIEKFKLVLPPDWNFRFYLIGYGILNFIISIIIEMFVLDYIFFEKLNYRCHDDLKSKKQYNEIDKRISENAVWPKLSIYENGQTASSYETSNKIRRKKKLSRVKYTEICHDAPPFGDNPCVFNSFFTDSTDISGSINNENMCTTIEIS